MIYFTGLLWPFLLLTDIIFFAPKNTVIHKHLFDVFKNQVYILHQQLIGLIVKSLSYIFLAQNGYNVGT